MIYFSPVEILCSLLHAVVFGMGFSFIYQLFVVILRTVKSIPGLMNEILFAEGIFPFPSVKGKIKEGNEGGMTAFLSVIFFFLGFETDPTCTSFVMRIYPSLSQSAYRTT